MEDLDAAEIGVFGGSGLYSLLDEPREVALTTPYGSPSGPVHLGTIGGRRVAFLPRHGRDHECPPHRVNYRANLWALHQLGVTRVLGPCAVGLAPARDRARPLRGAATSSSIAPRAASETYFDGPGATHVSFADPYCPAAARRRGRARARRQGIAVHDHGTVVVVQGPRFSTRAESKWYRQAGGDVMNMTQYPEAYLARELGICYASIALITDYDVGVEGVEGAVPVTQAEVFGFFERNADRVRNVLARAIHTMPADRTCDCADATDGAVP